MKKQVSKTRKEKIYLGISIFSFVGVIVMLFAYDIENRPFGVSVYLIMIVIFTILYKKQKKEENFKNSIESKTKINDKQATSDYTSESIFINLEKENQISKFGQMESLIQYDGLPGKINQIKEDPLYNDVITYVTIEQKTSTSLIQRRFGIGYNRAARIIDVLEADRIIGPMNGDKPREVLITYEDHLNQSFQGSNSNNSIRNDLYIKIASDNNIANADDYLFPVLEYCLEQEKFSLDDFHKHFDFTFSKTSSYYDTLKALEVIDEKYNLTNDYSDINEIKDMIKTATQNNPNIVSLARLNNLNDGYEFEEFIANLLIDLGYERAHVTQSSNDYGVDVLAVNDGITYAFQCKLYSSTVGNSAVQEIVSGMPHYNAHVGIVVTNNYFTRQAIELAESNNIILWDGDVLIAKLNEVRK